MRCAPGDLYKADVNDLSSVGEDALIIKGLVEPVKNVFNDSFLNEGLTKHPNGLAVRNPVTSFEFQKSLETESIVNLEFYLIIGTIVQTLENEELEHHNPIKRRSDSIAVIHWFAEHPILRIGVNIFQSMYYCSSFTSGSLS